MDFYSILFHDLADRRRAEQAVAPECFVDLNLDQIVAAITAGRDEYNLKPFFYLSLQDVDAIAFRHEVMRDLSEPVLLDDIRAFAQAMRTVREQLLQSDKLRHPLQKQRWFLDATVTYCSAMLRLAADLSKAKLASRGFQGLRAYVNGYIAAEDFISLRRSAEDLVALLASIEYGVLIQDTRVDVRRYDGELDYSAQVLATFVRFRQTAANSGYKFDFADPPDVNHIEGQILDRVALLYPQVFAKLSEHFAIGPSFQEATILRFDREVQFYLAYIEHMARFQSHALPFCYPRITEIRDEIYADQGFDLALANTLLAQGAAPVCNDFRLRSPERIIVVSGPNQGGKTTFARTFGQLHYLASLGCPVPGRRAQLYLCDRIFTHFERSEQMVSLRGKLQDDLIRIHRIMTEATPRSIVIMNEIFTSTTLRDAVVLSNKIGAAIIDLDLYCVWVSFIDELSMLGKTTVSMVSTVIPENPTERTFKIVRRQADGLAYAISIAEKYRLTYDMIRQRIAQ
jgi:DNA mismatch repair protein MutS